LVTVQEWVESTLAGQIRDGYVMMDDAGVAVADFCQLFGVSIGTELAKPELERDFYVALSGPQTFMYEGEQLTMTAVEMGYQPALDGWHANGLI
jgi:hypothetical protein